MLGINITAHCPNLMSSSCGSGNVQMPPNCIQMMNVLVCISKPEQIDTSDRERSSANEQSCTWKHFKSNDELRVVGAKQRDTLTDETPE